MAAPSQSATPGHATRWLTSAVSKVAALLILLGLSAGTGALLAPSILDQLPPYGDESLGQIATQSVRLTRDYDVPDPEATDRRRQTALAEVRPIYDLDFTLLDEVESRVSEGFAFARSVLGQQPSGAARDIRKLSPTDAEQLRQELMGRLQTPIEPRDFTTLLKEGFSAPAEKALADLVRAQLAEPILEDRALLPADRDRGIAVHPQPEGEGQVLTNLDALRDLPAARADVERAADELGGELKPAIKRALGHLARGALRANLTYDAAETARRRERAQAEVAPVVLHFSRGERILEVGDRIEPHHLLVFQAIRSQAHPRDVSRIRLAGALLAGLLIFLCYKLVRPTVGHRPPRLDALFLATVLLANLAFSQALLVAGALLREAAAVPWPSPFGDWLPSVDLWKALPYAMPVTAGTVIVRALLGPELIGLYAVGSSVLFGLLRGEGSFTYTVFALAGSLVAARKVRAITRQRQLLGVGFFVATTNLALIACSELLAGHLLERQTLAELIAGAIGGGLAMPVVVGLTSPIFEAVFAHVSDRRLAELCNLNQPALKELIVRAPGTYHHSILLGGLAEEAAQAIGANPMLARAIGLYHDLGKGKTPLVFSENQKGGRETVSVGELAETLRRHVDDGVEMGRRHKLPRLLLDAIAQHHGTRLVGQSAEGRLGGGFISEIHYRGPLPRRRETALVLLADSIEAQSRRIAAKDLSRLRELIHASVMQVAAEGQLDESQLQLGDLPKIIDSFTESLTRILTERGAEPPALREVPIVGHRSALDIN